MLTLTRCNNSNEDFIKLTCELDHDLNRRYGAEQAQYDAHNRLPDLATALVAALGDFPAACGCFKEIDNGTAELKRIFVKPECRGKGIAKQLVRALEGWANELGYKRMVLETGYGQPEAIGLYEALGYRRIENYGPYAGMESSVCFAKPLTENAGARDTER